MNRRVVITALGVVGAPGLGAKAFWEGLLRPVNDPAAGIPDLDVQSLLGNAKQARRQDRNIPLLLAATEEAIAEAGDLELDPSSVAVIIGCSGGFGFFEDQIAARHRGGDRRVSPFMIPAVIPNGPAATVSIRYGFEGPVDAVHTACASGVTALDHGASLVSSGTVDAALVGAVESGLAGIVRNSFASTGGASKTRTCRPFDADRDGFLQSEGAGVMMLESYDHAVARGATLLAEVLGAAQTSDAHHLVQPDPTGEPAARAVELALEQSDLKPSDIRAISAHGSGTAMNDRTEADVYARVFGEHTPPIVATKGATGHSAGAASALEVITMVLAMRHGVLPPSANHRRLDPLMPPIDVVRHGEPRRWEPGPVISNNFGFGGHNASVVIAPV